MAYEPLTEEQYNKAIDSGLSHEQIIQFEQQRKIDESKSEESKPQIERQTLGAVTNVPGATSRAAIQSNPVLAITGPLAGVAGLSGIGGQQAQQAAGQGAARPSEVPTFQNQALDAYYKKVGNGPLQTAGGFGVSAVGLAADMLTDPLTVLTGILPKAPGASVVGKAIAESPVGKMATTDITLKNDKLAGNVINSLIKPAHKEFMFGKNPGMGVAKEGITAGNLDELATKVDERLGQLNEASQLIRNTPENINKTVNLNNIKRPLIDSFLELSKAPNVNTTQMTDIRKALMDIRNLNGGDLSKVSISDAYDIKKVISNMQNWSTENKSGISINKSLRNVYHAVDNHIDTAIPELQKINSRMADLISAKKSIGNRIEVLSKQEPGPTVMKLVDLPFAAMKTPRAKTILGKLLAKRYNSLVTK